MSSGKLVMLQTPIKRGLQTLLSTNGVRCFSSSSNSLRSRSVYDDTFFNMASNLMRSIEREFDNARRLFGRNLISLPDPTSLFRISELPATAQSSDLVQVDNEGNRKLHIEFDMSGFQPEEIKVRTQNHNLIISAKREKKTNTDYFLREFSQSYPLPKDLKLEDLKSRWSEEGLLTIEGDLPKLPEGKMKEREIKIEHGAEASTQKLSEGSSDKTKQQQN